MFHTKNGLYFNRNDDGSVTIIKNYNAIPDSRKIFEEIIDADTWASVIASMSKSGEGDNRFYIAKIFNESDNSGLLSFLNEQGV